MKTETGLACHGTGNAIPLKSVDVNVKMTHCVATVDVAQRYKNCESKPIEAVYSFPLPESSAVCKFEIDVDGKKVVGRVVKREEAKEEYAAALDRGDGAYMVGQDRPNVFTANVGNLLPDQEATIRISYAIELVQSDDFIRLSLPSTIAPRFISDEVAKKEDADKLAHLNPPRVLETPYALSLRVESECASCIKEISCPNHPMKVSLNENRSVVELNGKNIQLDQDIVILYKLEKPHEASALVAHDGDKKIVSVSLFPDLKNLKRKPCEFIFVVDKSGSMGRIGNNEIGQNQSSIRCAKEAMSELIDGLNPDDKFNITAFACSHQSLFEKSVKATPKNKEGAQAWLNDLDRVEVGSSTNVFAPLNAALKSPSEGLHRIVAVLTDGNIGDEEACSKLVMENKDCNVFAFGIGCGPNTLTLESLARAGRGCAEFIQYGDAEMKSKVKRQFSRIASSFLENVRVDWGDLEMDLCVPRSAPVLFDGDKLTLYGRVIGGRSCNVSVLADSEVGPLKLSVFVDLERSIQNTTIPVLMARHAIREIEEVLGAYIEFPENKKKTVLDLSLKYQIMSTQASFIAVDEREADTQGDKAVSRVIPIGVTKNFDVGRYGVMGVTGPRGMSGFCGPVGNGVPNCYPLAINTPLDRCILMPIGGSLYDTEIYDPKSPVDQLRLFQRPICQKFEHDAGTKGIGDTNMNQSAMLDYPREMSLVGFGLFLEDGISDDDRAAIINGAVFQFTFCGNRPYFTEPVLMFPNFQGKREGISEAADTIMRSIGGKETDCTPLGSVYPLPWSSEKEAFRIKPGEAFGVQIMWNKPPVTSKPIRIMAAIYGFKWSPR